jgi:lipoprotein-anchoring transpeptidase ErfK/SrfK
MISLYTRPATAPLTLALVLALAACNFSVLHGDSAKDPAKRVDASQPGPVPGGDPMAARDPAPNASAPPSDDMPRPLMQAQVVLDRLGFTPGVVDGKPGMSTRNALAGLQEARGLPVSGNLDSATQQALAAWSRITATRLVTIPADFASGPYAQIPKDPLQQAQLPCLCYASLDEKLAERFHTTVDTLKMLNPAGVPAGQGPPAPSSPATAPAPASPSNTSAPLSAPVYFRAGQTIRVPNVGGDAPGTAAVNDTAWHGTLASLGVSPDQPKAASLVVSKHKGTLKAYDDSGKLIAMYTATMGSAHDPLPLGHWKILGISHNPKYRYNPELFWDVSNKKPRAMLPSGPNNPVGVVWIDLNIKHYGIHGTPHPETIGRAESHGCVRLTNWDAARLAQMVSPHTKVTFEA